MDKEKLIKHIDYYLGGSQPSHYSDNGLYTKEGVIYAIRDFDDETEVLSQEWINEHVDYADVRGGTQAFIHVEDLRNLLVSRQKEPETLSQEWIDEHRKLGHFQSGDGIYFGYFVKADKLENLLVPKQEEPNDDLYILMLNGGFVTGFELKAGRVVGLERQSDYDASVVMGTRPFMEFIQKQVGGELHNITNPEEQKYYVLDTEDIPMLVRTHGDVNRANTHLSIYEKGRNTEHYQLTEQEIKNYDERYWAFRKPVEELE